MIKRLARLFNDIWLALKFPPKCDMHYGGDLATTPENDTWISICRTHGNYVMEGLHDTCTAKEK